jgi:uncharacterized protein GlcG (DUF336 family)
MPLTLSQARGVIEAAESRVSEAGVAVIIAVLDAGRTWKAFSRMDHAIIGSIDLAIKKARTAALFEATSEAVWEFCKPGGPAHYLELTNGGLLPVGGGIPLKNVDGELIGAFGVSGAPVVEQEVEISQAAAAAFAAELSRA